MNLRLWMLLMVTVLASGCAKGTLWKLGYLSPRVRDQWAQEEQYAKSWPTMRAEMTAAVDRANDGGPAEQQKVAGQLATMIKEDHRVLVRLHATQLLAKLPAETGRRGILAATEDPEADIRIAACQTLAQWKDSDSLLELQRVLGSDTNTDVRIAATRSMGAFGAEAAPVLRMALDSDHPALQLAAADSLESATGEDFEHNIPQWQEYLAKNFPAQPVRTDVVQVDNTVDADKSKIDYRKLFAR